MRSDSLDDLLSATRPWKPAIRSTRDWSRISVELLEHALRSSKRTCSTHAVAVCASPAVSKEALAQFTGGGREPVNTLQNDSLSDSFSTTTVAGSAPHPLARDQCYAAWRGHRRMGTSSKPRRELPLPSFQSPPIDRCVPGGFLYAELRHHLYEAGRIGELHEASERLTQYAISQINIVTPVPMNKESLRRIALISAVPDERRPERC